MSILRLVDTHAHLDEIGDLPTAMDNARAAGLSAIIAVGQDLASDVKVLEIAEQYPGFVYPALGWHPWYLKEDEVEVLIQVLGKPKAKINMSPEASEEEMKNIALKNSKVFEVIKGKTVRKVICVPGRLVNIVAN